MSIKKMAWCLWIIVIWTQAQAQEMGLTSRTLALGESMTATASGTSALWQNPAGMMSSMMYVGELGYGYASQTSTSSIHATIFDTKSNAQLGLGINFDYESTSRQDLPHRDGYFLKTVMGTRMANNRVQLGAGFRYALIKIDDKDVLEALLLDAGMIFQLGYGIRLGITGINLVNGGYDIEMPKTVALGLGYMNRWFSLSLDLSSNLSLPSTYRGRTWRGGLEYLFQDFIPIRMGYRYNEDSQYSYLSMGMGFQDMVNAFGLDLAYEQNLNLKDDYRTIFFLSIYL